VPFKQSVLFIKGLLAPFAEITTVKNKKQSFIRLQSINCLIWQDVTMTLLNTFGIKIVR